MIDARSLPSDSTIATDICVIGAGAAGISLGLELAGGPFSVCLLESGGLQADTATEELSKGRSIGQRYFPLHRARTRAFGGSTNCWQGVCLPLESEDFEARDWIPHSGWPFGRRELLPYYERALPICGLERVALQGGSWADEAHPLLGPVPGGLETRDVQIAPTRFGSTHRAALTGAPNIDVYLYANAVALELAPGERRVESVRVATLAGNRLWVRSTFFVLAAGGIENPRLLLASNRQQDGGLGNQNDLVGRFFMEHPHVFSAGLLPSIPSERLALYHPAFRVGTVSIIGAWKVSPGIRRAEQIADCNHWLHERREVDGFEQQLAAVISELDEGAAPARGAGPASRYVFAGECEQVPNPESRIRLAEERDALGVPRVELAWRLQPIDHRSAARSQEILARELGLAGVGRVQVTLAADSASWPAGMEGGRHHMGTTRMHVDSRHGVVDADGLVHGLGNLYVAGSSLFPTAGAANPTFTLIALAVRLADRLKRLMA